MAIIGKQLLANLLQFHIQVFYDPWYFMIHGGLQILVTLGYDIPNYTVNLFTTLFVPK